jgi:hypothetical protein
MIALIVLLVRLMIMCVVMAARLTYWMVKLMIMWVTAVAAAIGSQRSARQHHAVRWQKR